MPHVPAEDFGDVGIIRRYCDACRKLITLCWKGRDGEYCSNRCLMKTEMKDMATETQVQDAPVVAGKGLITSDKKSKAVADKKKAVAKASAKADAAPATKKADAAPEVSARTVLGYTDEAVITVHDGIKHEKGGLRGEALDCLKTGMTVGKLKAALAKKGGRMNTYTGYVLKTALELKLITIKK